jgi:hypothetical protein
MFIASEFDFLAALRRSATKNIPLLQNGIQAQSKGYKHFAPARRKQPVLINQFPICTRRFR